METILGKLAEIQKASAELEVLSEELREMVGKPLITPEITF